MNKIKYISIFTLVMIVFTFIVEFVALKFFTGTSSLFWVAPFYFWMFYTVALLLFRNGRRLLNGFMLFKGMKMFLTMLFMVVLAFIFRSHTTELIIYFLVYYMFLLIAESLFLLYIKKKR